MNDFENLWSSDIFFIIIIITIIITSFIWNLSFLCPLLVIFMLGG